MLRFIATAFLFLSIASANAAELTVQMDAMEKPGQLDASEKHSLGTIEAKDTRYGLLLIPHLKGLPHGMHGFHLHIFPSCANQGLAAGGHFDPKNTHKHLGPYNGAGHLGDLPMLYVNRNGEAHVPELAPRLSVAQLRGHSLLIELGSDKYEDKPTLNAIGKVVACGVVK